MEDIGDATSIPNPSTPDEAAKNINHANLFGVDPTAYKSMAPTLDPVAKQMLSPQQAEPAVADFMKTSTEHTALATPDVDHLNFIDKTLNYASDIIFNRDTDEQKAIHLNIKKMDHPDQFSEDDAIQLTGLNMRQAEFQESNYGKDGPTLPQMVGDAAAEIPRFMRRNADLIASFTGGGALLGSVLPGPGTLAGAGTGFGLGVASAFAVDAYDHTRGSVYNELSNLTKPTGEPVNLDETTKRYMANGLGVVSAGLMGAMGGVAVKMTPFLSKLVTPTMAKNLILNPVNAALVKTVMNIGEAAVAGGGMSGTLQMTKIISEEMARFYDGSEASAMNALQAAGERIGEVGKAAVAGGATAGVLATGFGALNFKGNVARAAEASDAALAALARRGANMRDVSPGATPELPPGPSGTGTPSPEPPSYPGGGPLRLLQGGNPAERSIKDAVDVLHLQDALESSNKVAEQSGMSKTSPERLNDFLSTATRMARIDKVFLAVEDLKAWANTPEKGAEARDLIDLSGVAAGRMNAPMAVDTTKFMAFAKRNPEASDLARQKADGPSVAEGRQFLTRLQDADAERIKVLQNLGLKPQLDLKLTPESNVSEITPSPKAPEKSMTPEETESLVRRAGDISEQLKSPPTSPKTVYHGTNSKFEDFDYGKGGGVVHFAEKEENAQKYSLDTGSGGRKKLKDSEVELYNTEHEMPNLKWDEKLKAWTNEDKSIVKTKDDILNEREDEGYTPWEAHPTDARTIEHQVDMNKVLDTSTKEGLEKLKSIIKPTNRRAEEFLRAIDIDLENGRRYGRFGGDFGHSFWSLTKLARGDEINKSLKEVVKQIQDAGYHGIRFKDDSHMTIGMFDPKSDVQPDTSKLSAELEDIKSKIQAHYMRKDHTAPLLVGDFSRTMEQAANESEDAFMGPDVYTKALETVIPEGERTRFIAAVSAGKVQIQDDINYALKHEMNQVADIMQVMAAQEALEEEKARIENDPRYAILDKFKGHRIADSKGKRTASIYSIDPKTLRDDQLHYTDHPRLKEHKVFAKPGEGVSADMAAEMLGGLANGDELLKVLASTPDRKQIIEARAQVRKIQDQLNVLENVEINWANKLKSYDNKTQLAYQLMKYLREKEWAATKQAIKRVALPPPIPAEVAQRARKMVRTSKVKDLNLKQWQAAERESRRIGVNAILKTEPDKAHIALEAQAQALQMQKFTLLSTGQINRALKLFAQFKDPAVLATLRIAGKLYFKAAMEILDVFNLDPSKKGTGERDAFAKFVQSELRRGRNDLAVPEGFLDVRQSWHDMTVEQVLVVEDRLRAILGAARLKNQLLKKQKKRKEIETMEMVRFEVAKRLPEHPGYNRNKIPPVQKDKRDFSKIQRVVLGFQNAFTNMEHVLRELDNGQFGGHFQALLFHKIKGDGQFDGECGYSRELNMTHAFLEHVKGMVEKYGEKDFRLLEARPVHVPEFKNVRELNYGKLTKADLMTLWAYGGDPYLKQKRFENNGGVDHEVMQAVFDRELEPRDVDFMQGMVDMYHDYRPETAALQKRFGRNVQFVEGIPNRHRDRVLSGGYVPAKYAIDYAQENVTYSLETLENRGAAGFDEKNGTLRQFAGEQTEQGRLIERTDSSAALDLSLTRFMRGHEEVIHDLCYREACIDALKVLKDKAVREHIIATVGLAKYNLLVDTVVEVAIKAEAENLNYFSDQTRFLKNLSNHLQDNFNKTVLAANKNSILIQLESMAQVFLNMGPTSAKHFLTVSGKIMGNLDLVPSLYHFANELDPTIGHFLEGMENKLVSNVMALAPKEGTARHLPGVRHLGDVYEKMMNLAMSPMQGADVFLKMMTALAAYSQFMEGDVPNFSHEQVMLMSPEERHNRAQAYVRQISRLSLTHGRPEDKAPFQKTPGMWIFAAYWNDARNVLNNNFSMWRRTRWKLQEANQAFQKGRWATPPPGGPPIVEPPKPMSELEIARRARNRESVGRPLSGLGGGGSGGPPKGPTKFDDMRAGGGPERPGSRWKDANEKTGGSHLVGAAGLILGTMVAAMVARTYSDNLRGNQQTPLDQNFDLTTEQGIKDFAEYNAEFLMTSPLDQMATTHPLWRSIEWAGTNIWSKSKHKQVEVPISKVMSDMATVRYFMEDYIYTQTSPTDQQIKSMLNTESYIFLPLPVTGMYQANRFLNYHGIYLSDSLTSKVHIEIQDLKKVVPNAKGVGAELEHIEKQLGPPDNVVPERTADVIKYAETGAKWTPDTPNLYNFSADQWKHIQAEAPQLGLTEGGRVSKDTLEQDLAMDWSLKDTAKQLYDKEMPVNQTTLYGAHKFGVENYAKIYEASGDEKLKSVLGPAVIEKNEDLAHFSTVRQVKQFIEKKLNEGRKAVEKPSELTSNAPTKED